MIGIVCVAGGCHTGEVNSKEKRPYHHGDLRAALLRAGEQALRDGDIESFSLRDLSRELGVSNYAPRRHFSNKQALLDEIALKGFQRLGALLDDAVANKNASFEARMTRMSLAYIKFATENSTLVRLMFAAKHNKNAPPSLMEANLRTWRAGPTTVRDGQNTGEVIGGDPARLAMIIFATVEGLISMYTDNLFGVSLEDLTEEMVGLAIQGLRPRT